MQDDKSGSRISMEILYLILTEITEPERQQLINAKLRAILKYCSFLQHHNRLYYGQQQRLTQIVYVRYIICYAIDGNYISQAIILVLVDCSGVSPNSGHSSVAWRSTGFPDCVLERRWPAPSEVSLAMSSWDWSACSC